jgi:hypothetical protein
MLMSVLSGPDWCTSTARTFVPATRPEGGSAKVWNMVSSIVRTRTRSSVSPLSAEVVRRETQRQLDELAQEDWGAGRTRRLVPGVSFRVLPDGLVLTPTGAPWKR